MALWTQKAVSAHGADQALPHIDTIRMRPVGTTLFNLWLIGLFQVCVCVSSSQAVAGKGQCHFGGFKVTQYGYELICRR